MERLNPNVSRNVAYSGFFLALGLVIPYIFHSVPDGGRIFLPMHIPVLLCGFLLPRRSALVVGAFTPLLSFLITGMPEFYPRAVVMVFEMLFYAGTANLLYNKILRLKNKILKIYASLIIAMLVGRIVSAAGFLVTGTIVFSAYFTYMWGVIAAGAVGIVIQILLIPAVVIAVDRYFRTETRTQ
jgi:hypothetical protein